MRKIATICALSLAVLSLNACGSAQLPVPHNQPEQPSPALSDKQARSVLNEINQLLEKSTSREELSQRLGSPALEMRLAQIQTHSADNSLPWATFPKESEVVTISNNLEWPRMLINLSKADANNQRYLQIIVQNDPAKGYYLKQWMRLLPGVTFPATASILKGAKLLNEKDSSSLKATLKDITVSWQSSVQSGKLSPLFKNDEFTKSQIERSAQYLDAIKDRGKYEFTLENAEEKLYALSLPNGDVLLPATFIRTNYLKDVADNRPLALEGEAGVLLGEGGKISGNAHWKETINILFLVPKNKKETVQVIGAEDVVTEANRD